MTEVVELAAYVCPQCEATTQLDPRFTRWCVRCGHGADPYPPTLTGRQAKRRDREVERSMALFASLQTAKSLRPSSGLSRLITAYSLLVHLIGVLALVAPVLWLWSGGPAMPAWFAVVVGALTFLAVRPRIRRKLKPDFGFGRAQAPRFYALLDRCAAELGAGAPDRVAVNAEYNAGTGRAGLAQRSFLIIGAPLWAVLTGPERIALLGHELGHQVNGDTTRSLLAHTAQQSLTTWTKLLNPKQDSVDVARQQRLRNRRGSSGTMGSANALAALLTPILMVVTMLPFFLIAVGCRAALTRLALLCGQRAEYLADELGARLAGTDESLRMKSKHVFGQSLRVFLGTRKGPQAKQHAETLWVDFREYVESIPDVEFQRRLIVDRLHNTRTDRSHPAEHLRLALLEQRPHQPGSIVVTDEEWAAIDAELAPRMLAAARKSLR